MILGGKGCLLRVLGMFGVEGMLCEEVGQSSIARTKRVLLMLCGSRGRVPHLVLIWTEIGVSAMTLKKK